MSYTKLEKEIEQYYKANNMPYRYNALATTKEEQAEGLERYKQVRDIIAKKWLDEKKYKELISCVHGGWFPYDEFTKPLEDYFAKEHLISPLKFLCERKIRFKIEDLLGATAQAYEYFPNLRIEEILAFDLETYQNKGGVHNPIGQLMALRAESLILLSRYIELLAKTNETEYVAEVESIRGKVNSLTIKKADLKFIKHKI